MSNYKNSAITDEILIAKLGDEIDIVSTIIFGKTVTVSKQQILDILKSIYNTKMNNDEIASFYNIKDANIVAFVRNQIKEGEIVDPVNIDFLDSIIKEPKIPHEKERILFLKNAIEGSKIKNEKILQNLDVVDLLSDSGRKQLDIFLKNSLLGTKGLELLRNIKKELQAGDFKKARLKIKPEFLTFIDTKNKDTDNLKNGRIYYIRIINEFVAIHDVDTLREVFNKFSLYMLDIEIVD